jgi:hypothetical protein
VAFCAASSSSASRTRCCARRGARASPRP